MDSAFSSVDTLFGIEKIIGSSDDDIFQVQSIASHFEGLTLDGGEGSNDQLSVFYLNGANIDSVAGTLTADGTRVLIKNFENYEGSDGMTLFAPALGIKQSVAAGERAAVQE